MRGYVDAVNAASAQPLDHDVALALELVGNHGAVDVVDAVGARIRHLGQAWIAGRNEQDQVSSGQALQVLDHELGGDVVDEVGEDDDQGAPLEARSELGEAEGEVGLFVPIVDVGAQVLETGKGGDATLRFGEGTDSSSRA